MVLPLHRVNVLTGIKSAKVLEDPAEYAGWIRRAKRPLLVLGPKLAEISLNGKSLLEYALEIAKAANIPTCATAHIKGKMAELGATPDCQYDLVEIANRLNDPEWQGVRKEGNHDLVILFGMRTDMGNQALSNLKHFAPHLKTMTLCKYVYPHADYSLPNFRKDEQWKGFLENLITSLKEEK
ncbi:MAG: CO dehydrogenase/acetyl-CoA synthase complex subunit epsilon [Chloroflexi bacterium]|nr:MAG: CO dehydrogenase/acetyl-CoA synthase complex subunit epsilon [Chloroflexota bacterium]RLC97249.1 MAG: CO dehydrogenase/acetyl-CoA synthase complex subunit epsilon [Chloroflexota bacterium]